MVMPDQLSLPQQDPTVSPPSGRPGAENQAGWGEQDASLSTRLQVLCGALPDLGSSLRDDAGLLAHPRRRVTGLGQKGILPLHRT